MKKTAMLLVALMTTIVAQALEVNNLKTQAYVNPIGIDVTTPSFSWMLSSEQRGVMQQSYNIRICTDRDMQQVVWESGEVVSNQSQDVQAKGFTTQARTRYYWQVTVCDNKGGTATSAETAYFETGLKTESAWNRSKWIRATTNPLGAAGGAEEVEIKDYEVEVKFQIQSLAAGLIFAAKDHNNYYMWQVNTLTGSPRFRPHRWQNGGAACLSENSLGVSLKNGEVHTLRIEVKNATTAVTYVDGKQVDTRTGDFAYGDFGFREDYDNGNVPEQAYFDDFVVTSGGKILLQEQFDQAEGMLFSVGSVQDGRLYLSGPGTYSWQQKRGEYVHYDVDVDMTLVNDNASICFSATASDTYMMWAINTFDVATPVVRRHVYNAGALSYNDTPIPFTKEELLGHRHHIRIACETPFVRTYIDDQLVDTYTDGNAVLAMGDVGFRVSATGNEREKAYFDNLRVTTYDAEGQPHVLLTEDFENSSSIFNGADIRQYDGSRQLFMEAATGSAKRLMQSDGSVLPGAPMMRKAFTATKPIQRARLYSTGLGVYNVYINGTRVGITYDDGTTEQDELKPGFTEMLKTVFYTTHDVTALLREGDNAIGAEVTSGWWNGGVVHGMYGSKPEAFRGMLYITYEDGTTDIIATDTSWTCNTNGALRKGDIYNGETYDARLESNWSCPEFDDSEWYATAVSTDFQGTIRAFEGPAVKAIPSLARLPKLVTIYEGTIPNGTTFGAINTVSTSEDPNAAIHLTEGQTCVIDLGQNAAGWVSFKAKGQRGTRLRFRFAEMPNTSGNSSRGDDGPSGSIYTANLRSAEATLYYTMRGDAEGEAFHPTSTYFGFRYIEIISSGDVELTDVVGETVTSATPENSSFCCSHPDVNQLYSNIMWGQRSNFVSVPTDCPQRDEREGWAADTQVYSMAGLYNVDTRTFYEKWMRDMRDSQRSDGAFPHIAPYSWGVGHGAAAWACAGVILPWKVYLMTGDKQILKDNWAAMERYMDFLATRSGDGYQYNGGETTYGDWVSFVNTDSRYCSVCYYAYDAQLMAKMARALSTSEGDAYAKKAEQYDQLFQNIRAEWQKRYTNATTGVPNIRTQCAFLMALRYNLLKDENAIKRTITQLRTAISSNAYKLNTGFLGTAILNQTLTEVGLNDEAYTLLLQRNCPSWLYSIDQGATTIWERWNSYTVADGYGPISMNSFNHYAYGIVAEWMFRHMAGIAPDESNPGFSHFILAPNPDKRKTLRYGQQRITSVDADFGSVYGPIRAAWQCEGTDEMIYEVTVPANTTATLYMPVGNGYELCEGGRPACECADIEYVGYEDGKMIYNLGSGTYTFSVVNETGVIDASQALRDEQVETTYTIGGLSLGQTSHNLPHGVYIQNGKKVVK